LIGIKQPASGFLKCWFFASNFQGAVFAFSPACVDGNGVSLFVTRHQFIGDFGANFCEFLNRKNYFQPCWM